MAKVKVVLTVPTKGAKAGDTIEVDSQELADELVAARQAVRPASKAKASDA